MDRRAPLRELDRLQRRHPALAVTIATAKKFSDDDASNLAVVVAFYAFFSIIPLLLVFVAVLGFVLAGDHSLMVSVRDSVIGQFPVVGETIGHGQLQGSVLALIAGALISLYSGLRITTAATTAFDHLWEIPKHAREGFVKAKLHGAALLAMLGTLFVVASGISGVVSGGLGGPLLLVFGIIVSILLNLALFLLSFRVLCSEPLSWRTLLPGATLAALLWTLLQSVGGVYIEHVQSSSHAYGTFAFVLGILAWLHLGWQATLFSAELNTVIKRRLWPWPLLAPANAEPSSPTDQSGSTAGARPHQTN